ncbi:MAG: septation protein SepH [Microbacteriaceae bacterium]
MREVRLADSESDALILETLDGEKFRLSVNDALKFAVRTVGPKPVAQSLTPRDIQDRIRAGESIDSIVESSGADAHFVSTFALPVLDELEHMISSARAVRLTIPGDRFNDDSQIEFGALIDQRLADNGAESANWSSKRFDATKWHITLGFQLGENYGSATWSFDPRRVELDPEDETAAALSTLETNPGPLPKSKFSTEPPVAFRKTTTSVEAAPAAATVTELKPKVEKVSVIQETAIEAEAPLPVEPDEAPAAVSDAATETMATVIELVVEDPELHETDIELTEAEDDVDESVGEIAAPQNTGDDELTIQADVSSVEPEKEVEEEMQPAISAAPPVESSPTTDTGSIAVAKKGRASMPSWDEIVFGTKSED